MDIQMQTAPAPMTGAASAFGGGTSQSAKGAGSAAAGAGGFMQALAAIMSGAPADDQKAAAILSVPGLAQLIASLLPGTANATSAGQQGQPGQKLSEAIDQVLAALNSNDDKLAEGLLEDDSLQQMLAGIQSLLFTLPIQPQTPVNVNSDAPASDEAVSGNEEVEALDSDLFVPLIQPLTQQSAENGAQEAAVDQPEVSAKPQTFNKQEAKQLLALFEAVAPFIAGQRVNEQTEAQVQNVAELVQPVLKKLEAISSLAATAQSAADQSNGQTAAANALPMEAPELPGTVFRTASRQGATTARRGEQFAKPTEIIESPTAATKPMAMSKLEILAAKTILAEATLKPVSSEEQSNANVSAFDSADSSQAVPLHDLLKTFNPKEDTIKLPAQPVPVQRFAEEMTQFVVKNFRVTMANGVSEAKISLHPDQLGQVDVKITVQNGQVVAHFMADTLTGKEMLEGQLSQLRNNLQNQGIQVDRLIVTQNTNAQSSMFQDTRQQQQQQQHNSGRSGKGKTNGINFESIDEELAQEQAAASKPVSNNGFDETV